MEFDAYHLGRAMGWSLSSSSLSLLFYSIYKFFSKNKKDYFRSIKLAKIWKRYFALFIDLIVLSFIIFYSLNFIDKFHYGNIIESVFSITLIWLYFTLFDSIFQGTIGKKIFSIKVINYNGNPISFKQAGIRGFGYFIYFIPLLITSIYGVKQGFHNHFAKTKVVDSKFVKKIFNKQDKKIFDFHINIDNLINTRLKIYKVINLFAFIVPIFYIFTFLLQPKIMRKITSIKVFYKYFDKKYHKYLSFPLNFEKDKNKSWFLSRNLFLAPFFLLVSIFLFFIGINMLFIMKSNYIYFSIPFFYTGYSSYRLAKVYFLPDAKTIIKKDTRRPIVLLHSFEDTNLSIFSYPMLFGIRKDIRLEEAISPILNDIGPFVSVGNPKHWIPRLGSTKSFEKDEDWQSRVLEWMERSRYLVFMINDSLGLEWELKQVIEKNYIYKTMIIFPDSETINYQKRIDFGERIFRESNIIISIPYNLKLLFFNSNQKSISITSSSFHQEEYEEAISLFIYYKETNRDMKLYPYF